MRWAQVATGTHLAAVKPMARASFKSGVRLVSVLAAGVGSAACSSSANPQQPGRLCTDIAVWSFRVHVEDSSTGAQICDANVTASDGSVDTPLEPLGGSDCLYVGVAEQLGTFQITTAKAGYRTSATMLTVDQSDGCHVITEDTVVSLDPQ
jgi:hypothetical protein